jgi:hypothetical protein
MLLQATCSTIAWLDGWTRLLLQHKQRLENQLSKFVPVIQGQGLLRRDRPPCMVRCASSHPAA